MTPEEKREQTIQCLADILRTTSFQVEYKVKKEPAGIKIIFEVTQEYMNAMIEKIASKEKQL